jgi:hypothetical protein
MLQVKNTHSGKNNKSSKNTKSSSLKTLQSQVAKVGGSDKNDEIEIVKSLGVVLKAAFFVVPMIAYMIIIYITILSHVNLLLYIFMNISYFFNSSESTIIYDTMQYKLFGYVDIILEYSKLGKLNHRNFDKAGDEDDEGSEDNDNSEHGFTKEPLFYLFNIQYMVIIIFLMYILMVVLYLVALLVVWFSKIVLTLAFGVKFDSYTNEETKENVFQSVLTNVEVYVGLMAAVFLYIIFGLYVRTVLFNRLNKTWYQIKNIDEFILNTELSNGGSKIDEDLILAMKQEGKGDVNGRYDTVKDIVLKYINGGNMQKAQQCLLFFTLYIHLSDNIPDTNLESKRKIAKYFFQGSEEGQHDRMLTFVSLNVDSKGIKRLEYEFEKLNLPDDNKQIQEMFLNLRNIIHKLNDMILALNIQNTNIYFGILIIVLFIATVLILIIFNYVIIRNTTINKNKTLATIATATNTILSWEMPAIVNPIINTFKAYQPQQFQQQQFQQQQYQEQQQ